ncbi:MAG: ABC transporter ATP-binding protein/permease [Thiocapsa sp.]|jgi:ABC-type multidrug transport system fused ATPase/permease subunit|nr:ABC transporter ATP-binding protein [Thiocapsa sp.]MCG6896916.1 ABC transporter ATP-binding protein/permease [Thiocapsa sp.]MCG6985539.1 ABC transporter ATP-binding protein/permease [Thiocapsa sp.]
MFVTYQRLWQLLNATERRQAVILLVMILVMGLLQMLGVASVMPFMSVVADPAVVETNAYLAAAYGRLGFTDPQAFLLLLGVLVFLALVISTAFRALTTYASVRFGEMRKYSLGRKLMADYLRQPYDWFLGRHSADLGKTILSETEQVIGGALYPAILLISEGAVVLAVTILLILADPLLALGVAVGVGGAYGLIYAALRGHLHRVGAERLAANRERYAVVQETFGSIKDVKVGGLEGPLLVRFEEPARRFAQAKAMQSVVGQMPRFVLEALAFGGLLLAVIYLMTRPGGLDQALPVLAVYALGAYRLMPALQRAYAQLVTLRFSAPALESLHRDLTDLAPEDGTGLPLERARPLGLKERIRLEQVTYSYPDSPQPALRDLSLEIPARATVGLVGRTGSGKTTTVDVILGLLTPQAGSLTVDDTPITADNLRAWQATVGYVPQQIYLADASVRANIAFGVPPERIDNEAVERAARIANLHQLVNQALPQGYDTPVGERGVRLSGGQRQRVGIARALYHDPELLILDEATSALDNLTEQAVMDAVRNLARRKTVILIAHRLTTVRECDRIYLLDQGQLTGQGDYERLAASNADFRRMAQAVHGR